VRVVDKLSMHLGNTPQKLFAPQAMISTLVLLVKKQRKLMSSGFPLTSRLKLMQNLLSLYKFSKEGTFPKKSINLKLKKA